MSEYTKKSINELSDIEINKLIENGHIAFKTKYISELSNFYYSVIEEKKRRELKLKELQKASPLGKYYKVETPSWTCLFTVIDCKEIKNDLQITHLCYITGAKIIDNSITSFSNSKFEKIKFGWNSNTQTMMCIVDTCNYEALEISKKQIEDIVHTLQSVGFDTNIITFYWGIN